MQKIKTGDRVIVIAGKEKGKTGKVLQVFPELAKIAVEGVNMLTKHVRGRAGSQAGQKVSFPNPLHISNVMLIDPKTQKGTRVRIRREAGKATRVAARSGEPIV